MANIIDLCIPTYNESKIIAESLRDVAGALFSISSDWTIIVSDNGSTDGTKEMVESLHMPQVRVLSIPERGKGGALIATAQESKAKLFGFIDADLSADPKDMKEFVRYIEKGDADIVIGSRLLDMRLVQRGFFRTLSSQLFNTLRRSVVGISVMDSQCGFKVMNARGREILAQCTEKGWFIDIEFLRRAELAGLIIREIPIHWVEKRFSGHESKLRLVSDGWKVVPALLRIRRAVRTVAS